MFRTVGAETENTWQPWAKEFYAANNICTVATIDQLHRSKDLVSVFLDVESSTAQALADSSEADREDWMALHCPYSIHSAWEENSPEFDVVVSATLGDKGRFDLSCARYHHQQALKWMDKKDTVLARIKALMTLRRDD